MSDKYSIKEVKTMLKYKGAKLLSDNYIKNNKKIKIECKNGHILNTSLTNFMVVGCKFCNKKEKIHRNYIEYKELLELEGYKMISDESEMLTRKTKLKIRCPHGHITEKSLEKFKYGRRCKICSNNQRYELDDVKNQLSYYGLELISEDYINNKSHIRVRCKNGHEYNTSLVSIKRYKHCRYCYGYSGERKINEILTRSGIFFEEQKRFIDCKDKNTLPFDFYLPDKNLLIEYDGEQHFHQEHCIGGNEAFKITQYHDEIKNEYCKEKNINLLRIPYWEYENIETILEEYLYN